MAENIQHCFQRLTVELNDLIPTKGLVGDANVGSMMASIRSLIKKITCIVLNKLLFLVLYD